MKNNSQSDNAQSTILGWKFVAIVGILTSIFFTFLYLAMSSEPDYMPSHQRKVALEKNAQSNSSQPKETSSAQ